VSLCFEKAVKYQISYLEGIFVTSEFETAAWSWCWLLSRLVGCIFI